MILGIFRALAESFKISELADMYPLFSAQPSGLPDGGVLVGIL